MSNRKDNGSVVSLPYASLVLPRKWYHIIMRNRTANHHKTRWRNWNLAEKTEREKVVVVEVWFDIKSMVLLSSKWWAAVSRYRKWGRTIIRNRAGKHPCRCEEKLVSKMDHVRCLFYFCMRWFVFLSSSSFFLPHLVYSCSSLCWYFCLCPFFLISPSVLASLRLSFFNCTAVDGTAIDTPTYFTARYYDSW